MVVTTNTRATIPLYDDNFFGSSCCPFYLLQFFVVGHHVNPHQQVLHPLSSRIPVIMSPRVLLFVLERIITGSTAIVVAIVSTTHSALNVAIVKTGNNAVLSQHGNPRTHRHQNPHLHHQRNPPCVPKVFDSPVIKIPNVVMIHTVVMIDVVDAFLFNSFPSYNYFAVIVYWSFSCAFPIITTNVNQRTW